MNEANTIQIISNLKTMHFFVIFALLFFGIQAFVLEKGKNVTEQMEAGIRKSIRDSSSNCSLNDRSCFAQIVGLKIQNLYGKSWNVHLLQKTTSMLKGRQYSHDRWITLINEGQPAYTYYIFKPIDCSKPLKKVAITQNFLRLKGSQRNANLLKIGTMDAKQYWGSSMTESLKTKVKQIVEDAYKVSQDMNANADYIQNKIGPGRWQIVIWNTSSFDYMDTCMYASYFGLLVGVERGTSNWSYYLGRMSLI